ncbi:MAG TPA: serine/threonine-protein kinase [Planctomycetota bacterium]|nr:serine/threonine-protein kinase [Planctomycetota bacterium]
MADTYGHETAERVGDYVLAAPAGRGPGSEVWKAAHRADPARVAAIKLFGPGGPALLAKPADLEALDHPNIVRVEGVRRGAEPPHVLREWVEGESLEARIGRKGALSGASAKDLAAQTLRALQYAHGRGVPHGNLKESDLLLADDGRVRVVDFGFAPPLAALEDVRARLQGRAREDARPDGWPAPEVVDGAAPDARADLFSLGCVLWRALTGRRPSDLTLARRMNPGAGTAWDAFLARLLSDRKDRFSSADEALEALGRIEAAPARGGFADWFAVPFFLLGVFFVAYVAAGLPGLQPSLRILAGLAGFGLAALGGRFLSRPWSAAFFWGGLFWAMAGRAIHPAAALAGLAVAAAGGLAWWIGRKGGQT